MVIKRKIEKGEIFTTRTSTFSTDFSTREEIRESLEQTCKNTDPIKTAKSYEKQAVAVLDEHGLIHTWPDFLQHKPDKPPQAKDAWFVILWAHCLRDNIKEKKVNDIAYAAMHLEGSYMRMKLRIFEPKVKTGREVQTAAAEGHKAVHGTEQEKNKRWDGYKQTIKKLHFENPSFSYSQLCVAAAKSHNVSSKTIQRHTDNPHKKIVRTVPPLS